MSKKKVISIVTVILLITLSVVCAVKISNYDVEKENNMQEENNENNIDNSEDDLTSMKISVSDSNNTIIFALNESEGAKDLYNQLPMEVDVENFSNNEKIFYPVSELDVSDTPLINSGGPAGVLAYYAPWGDVVMFYGNFTSASRLYQLGEVIEGQDLISNLAGQIRIEKYEK